MEVGAAEADGVHLRIQQRQADAAGKFARDHRSRAARSGVRGSICAHDFADAGVRDEHVQGWRYQLSVFGNVVTDLVNAGAANAVDAWFAAWSETNESARRRALDTIATSEVSFRDRFSLLDGIDDVVPHITATQRFMPNMHLKRRGDIRHCQGTLLVNWVAMSGDGQERGTGMNVFTLDAGGKITSVIGFWDR